jgi:hypothetical protein
MSETIGTEETVQLLDLRLGALITPDEGGTNHFIADIQQNCPVHLSGEADAGDFIGAGSSGVESAPNRQTAGSPPIARILFRPLRLRRGEGRVLLRAPRDDVPVFIDDQSAGSAGAVVNPEKLDTPSVCAGRACLKKNF